MENDWPWKLNYVIWLIFVGLATHCFWRREVIYLFYLFIRCIVRAVCILFDLSSLILFYSGLISKLNFIDLSPSFFISRFRGLCLWLVCWSEVAWVVVHFALTRRTIEVGDMRSWWKRFVLFYCGGVYRELGRSRGCWAWETSLW